MIAVKETLCVMCVSVTKGDSGDGCDLVSTLCKYYLKKICFICILLLPLVARCLETIDMNIIIIIIYNICIAPYNTIL